uniref:Uncharacterized protein n=1 Tax=Caenorhabditis japonica TaxID=281687 RepID=A0A8R1EN11_CAEJA
MIQTARLYTISWIRQDLVGIITKSARSKNNRVQKEQESKSHSRDVSFVLALHKARSVDTCTLLNLSLTIRLTLITFLMLLNTATEQ